MCFIVLYNRLFVNTKTHLSYVQTCIYYNKIAVEKIKWRVCKWVVHNYKFISLVLWIYEDLLILVKVKNNIVSIELLSYGSWNIFTICFHKFFFGMSLGGRIRGNIKGDHHSERKTQCFIQCHVGQSRSIKYWHSYYIKWNKTKSWTRNNKTGWLAVWVYNIFE